MSDQSTSDPAYASAGSLKGMLQRGRGLGALPALDDPATSAELVYDVVGDDWRWDSVDDRHLYLARLIQELGLPLDPLVALLGDDEDDCERATLTLELLAVSGSAEAREALRAYIREGEHWVDVLESVAGVWPVEWWDDLVDVARARLTGRNRCCGGPSPGCAGGRGRCPSHPFAGHGCTRST